MKITHVIFSLDIGGSETMLVDIINQQIKSNVSIELLIINKKYNSELIQKLDKRVKVKLFNRTPRSRNIFPLILFNLYLLQSRPHVIHFHDHTGVKCLLAKNFHTLLTVHCMDAEVTNLGKYDVVCAISEAVLNDIANRSNVNPVLIPNGINFNSIDTYTNKSHGAFKLVQIGRLDHLVKGQDTLLKAIAHIRDTRPNIQLQLDIIGEGDSFDFLSKLVQELKLDNYVRFLGLKHREYIYKHLCEYNLLVQPSISEGFGLSVVEGIAAKIPVLVSDNDGPMEIIDNGRYGYFFKTGDYKNCAEKIIEILDDNSIASVTKTAFDYAFDRFNIQSTAQKYLNLYLKMVGNV